MILAAPYTTSALTGTTLLTTIPTDRQSLFTTFDDLMAGIYTHSLRIHKTGEEGAILRGPSTQHGALVFLKQVFDDDLHFGGSFMMLQRCFCLFPLFSNFLFAYYGTP